MNRASRLILSGVLCGMAWGGWNATAVSAADLKQSSCGQPVLSRVVRHRISAGETIETIAQQYGLISATLIGMNPALRNGSLPVGSEILIPPFNGIQVQVPAGSTWRDLAAVYNVRADVLFEANGCLEPRGTVFVPGVNWSPADTATATDHPLRGYPLPNPVSIATGYGWQLQPSSGQVVFNSGVDLPVASETSVLAVGPGVVAFAGTQGSKLVVVNHQQGLQTRYIGLDSVGVSVGQTVQQGARLGTIGTASATLRFEVRSNSSLGWVAQNPADYIPQLRQDW